MVISSGVINQEVFAAGKAKPNVKELGAEANYKFLGGAVDNSNGGGLFDGTTPYSGSEKQIAYFYKNSHYVDIEVFETLNIWRCGSGVFQSYYGKLKILKFDGNDYSEDVTEKYSLPCTQLNSEYWEEFVHNLPQGKYRFQYTDSNRADSEWYCEKAPITSFSPQLNILPASKTVNVGEEFTTEVVVNNVYNIFAEDVKLAYDTKLFDYVGYEDVKGLKVYKENHDSATGTLRFIIASQGKSNPINENGTIIKLKFKAKAVGEGKVDALAGRIADITTETDIETEDCGEALITVKGYQDVNKSGEFSLVDLAIDGYYFGEVASNTDKTKYDADVVIDNNIDDKDLSAIVNQILVNKNYKPNM
jgi:hypothetical protein